jgi:hypothetical protein
MSIDRRSTRRAKPSGDGESIEPKCGIQYHQTTKTSGVLERVEGIEPSWPAWKAGTLPLSYTRINCRVLTTDPTRGQPATWRPPLLGGGRLGRYPNPLQRLAKLFGGALVDSSLITFGVEKPDFDPHQQEEEHAKAKQRARLEKALAQRHRKEGELRRASWLESHRRGRGWPCPWTVS